MSAESEALTALPEQYPELDTRRLQQLLLEIYGHTDVLPELLRHLTAFKDQRGEEHPLRSGALNEGDLILITYGDSIQNDGAPLETLRRFVLERIGSAISAVHILPFFPFSSDDGFSVIDYRQVRSDLGSWKEVEELGHEVDLMFDIVVNHVSRQSLWFVDYIHGEKPYCDYFIEMDPATDLSDVVRPRNSPLLTEIQTHRGVRHLWTTFSDDQIDLNFANPDVLIEFIDILLFYVSKGARYLRLDAITFLWKTIGTRCVHLPQTHAVVKLFREILTLVAPEVVLLTETNVPHHENISYFSTGDEAQLIYQFALPPLILHALNRGHSQYLTGWADSLEQPPQGCAYLNFTASHDGVGLRAVEAILPEAEITALIESMHQFGGFLSMKQNADGSESPYEINISYFDAMIGTRLGEDTWQVARFICSQAIMLSMQGVPALYLHCLTATPNDHQLVEKTGRTRSINRRSWREEELLELLDNPVTSQSQVFNTLCALMTLRRNEPCFHPTAPQKVLHGPTWLFALQRTHQEQGRSLFAFFNVTAHSHELDLSEWLSEAQLGSLHDLRQQQAVSGPIQQLAPYQFLWLVMEE